MAVHTAIFRYRQYGVEPRPPRAGDSSKVCRRNGARHKAVINAEVGSVLADDLSRTIYPGCGRGPPSGIVEGDVSPVLRGKTVDGVGRPFLIPTHNYSTIVDTPCLGLDCSWKIDELTTPLTTHETVVIGPAHNLPEIVDGGAIYIDKLSRDIK